MIMNRPSITTIDLSDNNNILPMGPQYPRMILSDIHSTQGRLSLINAQPEIISDLTGGSNIFYYNTKNITFHAGYLSEGYLFVNSNFIFCIYHTEIKSESELWDEWYSNYSIACGGYFESINKAFPHRPTILFISIPYIRYCLYEHLTREHILRGIKFTHLNITSKITNEGYLWGNFPNQTYEHFYLVNFILSAINKIFYFLTHQYISYDLSTDILPHIVRQILGSCPVNKRKEN